MDIDLLRTFEAIRETGSFTAAADRVGRTQSAVSLQMKRLEERLGRPLFVRNRNPVTLTPYGEELSAHARRILGAYDEALAAFDRKSVEGVVALGLPSDYAPRILPLVLRRFVSVHPRARVDVVIDQSRNLVRGLAEGAIDLAFVTEGEGPVSTEEPAFREPFVWVGPPDDTHLSEPVPLAVWSEDATPARWMTEALAAQGRSSRIVVKSPNLHGLTAAVEAGLALTALAACNVTPRMRVLGAAEGFPALPVVNVMLERARFRASAVIVRLEEHLRVSLTDQSGDATA